MGKGSGRRPTLITEAEFQANYDRTFRTPQAEKTTPCRSVFVTDGGHRVRCSITSGDVHDFHNAEFDGKGYLWEEGMT